MILKISFKKKLKTGRHLNRGWSAKPCKAFKNWGKHTTQFQKSSDEISQPQLHIFLHLLILQSLKMRYGCFEIPISMAKYKQACRLGMLSFLFPSMFIECAGHASLGFCEHTGSRYALSVPPKSKLTESSGIHSTGDTQGTVLLGIQMLSGWKVC